MFVYAVEGQGAMSSDFITWEEARPAVLAAFDTVSPHWGSVEVRLLAPPDDGGGIRPQWVRMMGSFDPVAVSAFQPRFRAPLLLHGRLTVPDARAIVEAWFAQERVELAGIGIHPQTPAVNVTLRSNAELTATQTAHEWALDGVVRRFRGLHFHGYSSDDQRDVAHKLSMDLAEKAPTWGFRDRTELLAVEMGEARVEIPTSPWFEFAGPIPLTIEGSYIAPEMAEFRIVWQSSVDIAQYQLAGPGTTWSMSQGRHSIYAGQGIGRDWRLFSMQLSVPPEAEQVRAWLVKDDEPYLDAVVDLTPHTRERQLPLALEDLYPRGALRKVLIPETRAGDAKVLFEEAVVNLFASAGYATLVSGHNRKARGIDCLAFDREAGTCYCVSATVGASLPEKLNTLLLERNAWQRRLDLWGMRGLIASPVDPGDVRSALEACFDAGVLVLAGPQLDALADAPHLLRDLLRDLQVHLAAWQRSKAGSGIPFRLR